MTTGTYDDRVPGARMHYPTATNDILRTMFDNGLTGEVTSQGGPGCSAIALRFELVNEQVVEYLITNAEASLPSYGEEVFCQVYDGEDHEFLGQVYAGLFNQGGAGYLYSVIRFDMDKRQMVALKGPDAATRGLLAEYRDWKSERDSLHQPAEVEDGVESDAWYASNDVALSLLDRFAAALEEATA